MYLKPLPQTAFSIVRRDIAEARAGQHAAQVDTAKYRRAIEVAIERLVGGEQSRDGVRARIDRAVAGLRVALVG